MKKSYDGPAITKKKVDAHSDSKIKRAIKLLDSQPEEAMRLFNGMLEKMPENALLWMYCGLAHQQLGELAQAEECLNRSISISPNNSKSLYAKSRLLFVSERFSEAESFIRQCMSVLTNSEVRLLSSLLAIVLQKLKKYQEAILIYESLIAENPCDWSCWNQLGIIYQEVSDFNNMDLAYRNAQKLATDNPLAYFNHIVSAHYNPTTTIESLRALCQQWQSAFKPKSRIVRAKPHNLAVDKKLRIGLISDGFRSHPVGIMIAVGLSHVLNSQMEFYFYSTNIKSDHITQRIKNLSAKWKVIDGLSDEALNLLIREDEIDILFDLNGYNANSRMLTFQMEPAPVQIKWVGGLISSTGLTAMDYLLSDNVETPVGCDEHYSEKLIRLPVDYICYDPPSYLPPINEAPVIKNGFITFGCFNNASKINDELLAQWAIILSNVPNSHLFLKSFNFSNPLLSERIMSTLETHGISRDRVILEGSSPHKELLASYNKVDIALDPWPYSGGLTTCEAMCMGIPVVTLPGPTFAGRHSASHLIHAGMPELVAKNWQQYNDIAVGLTQDLNSLSTIRHHLREILLSSPVCDSKLFSQHFSDAMRAVWQRYCEGKAPETLRIDGEEGVFFLDDNAPLILQHPEDNVADSIPAKTNRFSFELSEKITMVDYGGRFARHQQFKALMSTNGINGVVFDPLGVVEDKYLPLRRDAIHLVKLHLLGDGNNSSLYMCLDPRFSSDLQTISAQEDSGAWNGKKVLAELSAPSSRLDEIDGLQKLEWLILDNGFNINKTIENGSLTIQKALFISVWYSFDAWHLEQMSFSKICERLKILGFSFHAFFDIQYEDSSLEQGCALKKSSKMIAAQLLFMPDENKIDIMNDEQLERLAFITHTGYQLHDVTFKLLQKISTDRAKNYLCNLTGIPESPDLINNDAIEDDVDIIPHIPRMSPGETELLTKYLKDSVRYFEFGSGGSTKLAIRNNVTVYGVESDKNWIDLLIEETGPLCKVSYVDIGPTKEWGYPVDDKHKEKFPLYSESILSHQDCFDLILIDGRFRVACTLNAIIHTLKKQGGNSNTKIFIHDFWDRKNYHSVLDFLDVVEKVDTAGIFKLKKNIDLVYLKGMLERYKFISA